MPNLDDLRPIFERIARDPAVINRALIDRLELNWIARAPSYRIIRSADLVVLDIRLVNIRRTGGVLARINPSTPGLLVVTFPFQAVQEEAKARAEGQKELAKTQPTDSDPPDLIQAEKDRIPINNEVLKRPFLADVAGPSRLVLRMPEGGASVADTTEGLLEACTSWPLVLSRLAEPDSSARVIQADFAAMAAIVAGDLLAAKITAPVSRRLSAGAERIASEIEDRLNRPRPPIEPRWLVAELDKLKSDAFEGLRGLGPYELGAATMLVRARVGEALVGRIGRLSAAARVRLNPKWLDLIYIYFRKPQEPGARETMIEIPTRLMASPLPNAGFANDWKIDADKISHAGRTELWHTHLGDRSAVSDGTRTPFPRPGQPTEKGWDGQKMRFLWSPDYPKESRYESFRSSLDDLDRRQLVRLTAGYDEKIGNSAYVPRPVHLRRLMLSALGGDLEGERRFEPRPEDIDLVSWVQRSALGRDYFVRLEYAGFLYPFGHRAVLVKLTERTFGNSENGATERLAYLRQRFFIIVREPVVFYPAGAPMPHAGRGLPFTSIRCLYEVTPDLAPPDTLKPPNRLTDDFYKLGAAEYRRAYWPCPVGTVRPLLFPFIGRDRAARTIRFELPVMFVSETFNEKLQLHEIAKHYNRTGTDSVKRRRANLGGQTLRLAPASSEASDVDYPARWLTFEAVDPTTGLKTAPQSDLQAFPALQKADVRLATLERITGQDQPATVVYDLDYLSGGLSDKAQVFAQIEGAGDLLFGGSARTESVGGLAAPDLVPKALSAKHGIASGDITSFKNGHFDPAEYFPDSAMLLGVFKLKDLLTKVGLSEMGKPEITTQPVNGGLETRFALAQDLDPGKAPKGLILDPDHKSRFELESVVTPAPAPGAPSTRSVSASLTRFKLVFANVLVLRFDELRYSRVNDRKPDFDIILNPQHPVTFEGPLEFLDGLKDLIPADGFSDPPGLTVTSEGVTASYGLGLPDVQLGVLSLSNVSLGAAFTLPFTGKPPVTRFNFAERHNTFNLTVSMFGGGGFFAIVVDSGSVREIEAALEFGARVSISLGVASGSVYVKGGFYFCFGEDKDGVEKVLYECYVELGERLSVLGLISVSLTFHLALTYQKLAKDQQGRAQTELVGQAKLVVEVEVLFFSTSVRITVERKFAGAEADPKFVDFMPEESVWHRYCNAFA
jgi:hypothetical protein